MMALSLILLVTHCAAFFTNGVAKNSNGVAKSSGRSSIIMQAPYRREASCQGPIDVWQVETLLKERTTFRQAREFGEADAVLADLRSLGVIVDDDRRTWCLRSWQRPDGNRREQTARHKRERADRDLKRKAKPQKKKPLDLDAPYQRSAICTATLSEEQSNEVADMVATRVAAKKAKDYKQADALLAQLAKAGVCVSDDAREWRADGGTFAAAYTQEAPTVPAPIDPSGMPAAAASMSADDEVTGLVNARALAKAARDYAAADLLLEQLLERGVVVDDRRRVWRVAATAASSETHDYVRLRQSDDRDAATGKPHLPLDPRLLDEVDALLGRRLAAKLAYRYEEADALQKALGVLGVETDERQGTWNVAFAYVESSWRVRE